MRVCLWDANAVGDIDPTVVRDGIAVPLESGPGAERGSTIVARFAGRAFIPP
jgi:hypothetical protein